MTANDSVLALVLLASVAFLWYCPIVKPWFGFWRPR